MTTDLPHLATRVFNTPLMVQPDKLDTILAVVGPRILSGGRVDGHGIANDDRDMIAPAGVRRRLPMGGYLTGDGIAVLPILGTLVRRGSFLDSLSGMTSYQALTDAVTAIFADGEVRGVIAEMDTPGGEGGGVFDLARLIRNLSHETGKPFWAHANEQADSAGYALASQAEEIWLATTAFVGSIGVVAAHIDMSKADEKAGQKWTYVYAGENKVLGNRHEPLSDDAKLMLQEDIDDLYSMFIDLVSEGRGVEAGKIRDTKASSYRGEKAVNVGLADKVGTLDEAIEAFATRLSSTDTPRQTRDSARKLRVNAMSNEPNSNDATQKTTSDAPESTGSAPAGATAATPPAPQAAPATPEAAQAAATAAQAAIGFEAERARCVGLSGVAAQAGKLGVEFDLNAAISGGVTIEAARETILNAAANKDAAQAATPGFVPAPSTGGKGSSTLSAEQKSTAWGAALKRRR